MKIALFGGSFDPFHSDHLEMIKLVQETNEFNEIWIIPTNQNPFKTRKLSLAKDRLNMIKLGIKELKKVRINTIELYNSHPANTYDTVKKLKSQYPHYKFYFMLGSDQLQSLDKWDNINELIKLQTFIFFERKELITPEILEKYQAITIPFINNQHLSSTVIRDGFNIEYQIPAITNYINEHLLYLHERLAAHMDLQRYQHSINVGKCAEELARIYNLNSKNALIAGSLHDITKRWTTDQHLMLIKKYEPEYQNEPDPTLHSYSGALHLKHHLLYEDKEILNAVKWHTVGRPNMTKFEMLIFVADKISCERNYPGVEIYRELVQEDLEKTFKELLKFQYQRAIEKNGFDKIGHNITATYQYYWGDK